MNKLLKKFLFIIGAYFIVALAYYGYMRFINKEAILVKITAIENQGADIKYVLLKSTFKPNTPIDFSHSSDSYNVGDIVGGTIRYRHPKSVVDFLKISYGEGKYFVESSKIVTKKSKEKIDLYYLHLAEKRWENVYVILRIIALFVVLMVVSYVRNYFRNPGFLKIDGSLVFRKRALITNVKIIFYSFFVLVLAGQFTEIVPSDTLLIKILFTLVALGFVGFFLVVEILGRKDYLSLDTEYISFRSFKKYREIPVSHILSFEFQPNTILLTTELETIKISLSELNIVSYEENIQLELRRLLLYRAEEIIAPKN